MFVLNGFRRRGTPIAKGMRRYRVEGPTLLFLVRVDDT
jgi:hypothetical protein